MGVRKAGTQGPRGKIHDRSSFNLPIAEGNDWKKVLIAVRRRMTALLPTIARGQKAGAHFQLDCGVMGCGFKDYFYRSLTFAPGDLRTWAAWGIDIEISTYRPTE
jgi:hypothetical protein